MSAQSTTIKRSWKSTFTSLVIALVAAVVSVLLFMYFAGGPITVGIACIPGVVALIFLYSAFGGAGESTCPSCGKALSGLSMSSNEGVLCEACHGYHEGTGGQLRPTDPATVSKNCLFASVIPETFTFPDACCVCGGPATQKIRVSLSTTNASSVVTQSTIGLTTSTRTTVEVPHCAEHKDGAMLTGTQQKPHIKFRSYPYLRAFCAANGTMPG